MRYASPSSFFDDNEMKLPLPQMRSRQEVGVGFGLDCVPTMTNSNNRYKQHASAQHRMNDHDGHYSSSHHHPSQPTTYCPQESSNLTTTTTNKLTPLGSSISCNQTQQGTIQQQQQKPTEDLRFLYTLYNILSSPKSSHSNVEASITWLDHGQGFFILNKSMFERTLLRRILPNVKYASFVKRLKRYKFVRISSGSELGAYYHPYFRRDQPHLLPLINTMDEIPMERYGVNVTNVVTFGVSVVGAGSSCNVARGGNDGGGTSTFIIDQPPVSSSNLKQDDLVPTAAAATKEDDDNSIHSASLSLGSISLISTSRRLSLTAKDDLSVDPSFFEGLGLELRFKEGDNAEEDDDVTLESLEDDALLDHLKSGGAVASCPAKSASGSGKEEVASLLDKALLLNKDIKNYYQELLQRVLQYERENRQQQVQTPQKQVLTALTPAVSPSPRTGGNPDSSASNSTEEDMKSCPDMLRQMSKAKRHVSHESSMSSHGSSCVEEDMKSFQTMLRQISKAKHRESSVSSQQKWNQMPSTSPVTSSFSTTTSTTSTSTTVFSIPTSISIEGGRGHDMKKSFQYSRRRSAPEHLDTIRENKRKHQYRRGGSTATIIAPRNTCYAMDEKSAKYRYPRSTKAFESVSMTSPTSTLQQQHPEEVQPYFVSLDWSQHSLHDSQLNHHHRNQLRQEQEPQSMTMMLPLPPSPPASTQSHQNSHNNHQQQLSETILHNVQQVKNLLYNRQQQN